MNLRYFTLLLRWYIMNVVFQRSTGDKKYCIGRVSCFNWQPSAIRDFQMTTKNHWQNRWAKQTTFVIRDSFHRVNHSHRPFEVGRNHGKRSIITRRYRYSNSIDCCMYVSHLRFFCCCSCWSSIFLALLRIVLLVHSKSGKGTRINVTITTQFP